MGKNERDFEAFEIFEQIQGSGETVAAQPLSRQQLQPAPHMQSDSELMSWPDSSLESQPFSQRESTSEFQPQQLSFIQPEPVRQPSAAFETKPVGRTIHEEAPYYEIEYDSCPMPGVGRFVLKSARTETPPREPAIPSRKFNMPSSGFDMQPQELGAQPRERDEVREVFNQMRDIARESRSLFFNNTKFYDRKIQQENSGIFYRQGMFMKDFEDACEKALPYSAYFPNYQMMGYGQLRTYFTWRTQVRQGNIQQTSLSYAFLYLYELLNNIGVQSPQEGLDRLMLFWDAYRVYDQSIDKYVLRWLKDYHIYYELSLSFHEFIEKNGLGAHYPNLSNPGDRFDLCCGISKYDIRKSKFYTDDRKDLIRECFTSLYERLQQVFSENRMDLDKSIFQPTRHMSPWQPFKEALFYPALQQADRRVVLSEKEIYLCSGNRWTFSTTLTTESGKQLLGYLFKQMESVLRSLTQYRHKITANVNSLSPVMADELRREGISLETVITKAVTEFYREATKTVVRVDRSALDRIREEALATQEKLVVPEEESAVFDAEIRNQPLQPPAQISPAQRGGEETMPNHPSGHINIAGTINTEDENTRDGTEELSESDTEGNRHAERLDSLKAVRFTEKGSVETNPVENNAIEMAERNAYVNTQQDPWEALKSVLTDMEKEALLLTLSGEANLKHFADAHGIMLEVLMDGINEKSMDCVGDSLLDDECMIYEDYIEQVKGMVDSI